MVIEDIGLVLEGGGMRGVYTAGVLEYFLEQNLEFPYTIGVSAGASMAASYLSKQKGRNKKVNIGLVADKRYFSLGNYLKKRQLFGMDFLYDEIPNKLVPFHYDRFFANKGELVVGTTDVITGEPVYFKKADYGKDLLTVLKASSSLPFIAPEVTFRNKILLDGGISDSIPVRRAEADGYEKNVVILTRNKGYRKSPSKFQFLVKSKYPEYTGLQNAMKNRYIMYNETLRYIEEEEKNGKLLVIRPEVPLEVGRMERNPQKLEKLYQLGYEDGRNIMDKILDWND